MENVISKGKGNYILVMKLEKTVKRLINRFGKIELLPGYYFYCGSAQGSGGIRGRVCRHLRNSSKKQWHIDHIKDQMQIMEVWYQVDSDNRECEFSKFFINQEFSMVAVEGFGASDCRKKCKSHLIMLPINENLDYLYKRLRILFEEMARFYPYTLSRIE